MRTRSLPIALLVGALCAMAGTPGCASEAERRERAEIAATGLASDDAARLNVAVAQDYDEAGIYEEAIPYYEQAMRLDPDTYAWISRRLGRLYALTGDPYRATQEYDQALRLDPNSTGLLLQIGAFELDQGRAGDAESKFRRAIEIDPGLTEGWVNLGLALGALERYPEAMEAFERAMPAAEARANVAIAMARNGDFDGAFHEMSIASQGNANLQRYNGLLEAMLTERAIRAGDEW